MNILNTIITCSLEERIYSNIDDISKKGVDSMLNEIYIIKTLPDE